VAAQPPLLKKEEKEGTAQQPRVEKQEEVTRETEN